MRPRSVVAVLGATLALIAGAAQPSLSSELRPPPSPGTRTLPAGWPTAPPVTADAYLLVDAVSGQTLAAMRPDEDVPAASTVKVLTAISVLRRTGIEARVTAGREVTGFPPTAAGVGLEPGETWTVRDLLEGLIARSGNDAAHALAVAIGGSVEGFVALMRADAQALGLDVRVTTPTGLGDTAWLSPRDLATLSRTALDDPHFASISARARVDLPDLGTVPSRNGLLEDYPGAYGVKTGYTIAAGRCLIAAAERDGRRLIAVVMGSDGPTDHFVDAARLLDFGFDVFSAPQVAGEGPEVELRTAGRWVALEAPDLRVLVPDDAPDVDIDAAIPIEVADDPGTLTARWRGSELAEVDLSRFGDAPAPTHAGAWLVDRAYAAMRAATVGDVWADR